MNKIRLKTRILFKAVAYVYKQDMRIAIARDLLFVISTGLDIYGISLGGRFIDKTALIIKDWDKFSMKEYFFTDSFRLLLLGLLLWMLIRIAVEYRSYLDSILREKFLYSANSDLLEKVSSLNLQEVESKEFQNLLAFVPSYSLDKVYETYAAFSEVIRYGIRGLSVIILLYEFIGVYAFFSILVAIPEAFFEYYNSRKIKKYRDQEVGRIKLLNYLTKISLSLANFAELRVNGTYKRILNDYNSHGKIHNDGLFEKFKHYHIDKTLFANIDQILTRLFIIFILAIAVVDKITIGRFKALYDYAMAASEASYYMFHNVSLIGDNVAYIQEFFNLLDYQGFGDISSGDVVLKSHCPVIKFQNVDFKYPNSSNKVLEDINLQIRPGEKVAFVGESGSGKTSLLKILCGLYAINSGDYMLDEYSIRELKRGEIKKKVSAVFQDFVRYNYSIKKNITISAGKRKFSRSLYEKVKDITGIDDFLLKENIKDTQLLGKAFPGGREISPGFWQKLAIARMLYRNSKIMVMDEPFTYLDGVSRERILDRIFDFIGDKKILIYITQETDHLKRFDRVYYFKHGRIVEEGTYLGLVRNKGAFYEETLANK